MGKQSNHYSIPLSKLILAKRFDAGYFRPEFIALDDKLAKLPSVKPLGALAEVEYGFMPTEDYASEEDGIPLIRVTNIHTDASIDMSDVKYIRKDSDRLLDKLVRAKDILMVQCGNTTGKVAMVPPELEGYAYASFCFRIRPTTEEVTPEYLLAVLFSKIGYRQVWRSITFATVRPNTTKPFTKAIKIPLPPLEVQDRIAKTIQDAYAARREKLIVAEELQKGIEAFVLSELGIDVATLQRHRAIVKPISQIAGGRFDFEAVAADLSVNFNGLVPIQLADVVEQKTDRILPPEDCPNDDVNYISLSNIASNTGELVDFAPVKGAEVLSSSVIFNRGDILFGRMRPYLNKVWIAEFDGICTGEAIVFRPNLRKVDTALLHTLLMSRITLMQIVPFQSGTSLPRVSASQILSIKLPIPKSIEKQKEISAEVIRRRAEAKHLRIEAEQIVSSAKGQVEQMILGETIE